MKAEGGKRKKVGSGQYQAHVQGKRRRAYMDRLAALHAGNFAVVVSMK